MLVLQFLAIILSLKRQDLFRQMWCAGARIQIVLLTFDLFS